jgi:hypothetical protein
MRWNESAEQDAATFFRAHYVLWAVGQLEPEVEAELDALSENECENWKQIMHRECSWTPQELRFRFGLLSRQMSAEEALEQLLSEMGFRKDKETDPHRLDISSHRRRFVQRQPTRFRLIHRPTF